MIELDVRDVQKSFGGLQALNGVSFVKAGDYSFEVIVDGQHKKSVPLYVMSTPPGPTPGQVA